MDQGQLIISFVSVIVMFIPVGGLLWKFSKIVFQVECPAHAELAGLKGSI
jgi:hypothetical protein